MTKHLFLESFGQLRIHGNDDEVSVKRIHVGTSNLSLVCCILLALTHITGCKRAEVTSNGEVRIHFKASSNNSYHFELSNSSDQRVTFLGWKQEGDKVIPLYSAGCSSQPPLSSGPAIFVGPKSLPIDTQQTIDLSPSSSLQLVVPKLEFASQAGARCFMTLLVDGGRQVNSDEFTP